jgi:type I restriction enzyme R subunit
MLCMSFLPNSTSGIYKGKAIKGYVVYKNGLIMRPYQISAVKAIVECIHQNRGKGYIWHTAGSGKTLT